MIGQRANGPVASPALDLYLPEIQGSPLLTADEECRLAEAIARGDREAKARLVGSNLRLVVKIARDYAGRGLSMDDLVGEGNVGLMRAAEEFDPRFGTRFSTYASHWIKQAIRHALTNTTAAIRLPSHMVGLLTKWRRAERALRRRLDRDPSREEVAAELGLSGAQRELVDLALRASHLRREGEGADDGSGWSPEEESDPGAQPHALIEADDERRVLLRRLDRLDDRERAVVALRYGLEGGPPLTFKEVARRLGVTREWARRIEIRAVRKLDAAWCPEGPIGPRDPDASPGPGRLTRRALALQSA